MLTISASLLSADFTRLGEDTKMLEDAGVTYAHLDVMDGIFVPNISFGIPVIRSLRKVSSLFFDVHLMITQPQRYLDDFIRAGADLISFHYESCEDPFAVARMIQEKGVKAAIALKPCTPAEVLFPILDQLDMVLVMTVEPGFGGQKMMVDMVEKVRTLRRYADQHGISIDIQVDGGIGPDTIHYATEAGANIIVAGSSIFSAKDPAEAVAQMYRQAELHPYAV